MEMMDISLSSWAVQFCGDDGYQFIFMGGSFLWSSKLQIKLVKCKQGVPQRGVLSPMLFNI